MNGARHGRMFVRTLSVDQHRRASPAGLAWWWRWEIVVVAVAAVVPLGLVRLLGRPLVAALLVAVLGSAVAFPASRLWLARRIWVVIVQHRLRVGLIEAGTYSRSGRLPSIWWTSATADGERLQLWCHAGVAPGDLQDAAELLAAACWARRVTVHVHPHRVNLVTVDVHRWERLQARRPESVERRVSDAGIVADRPAEPRPSDR